jgi:predicted transposase/invertase (TIGR01784 family)
MYDSSLKYKWDNENVLDYAKEEAKLEGRIEGKREGRIEGELSKAREIAFALKKEGFTHERIARLTKLSIEEIEKL